MEVHSLARIEQPTSFGRAQVSRLGAAVALLVTVMICTGVNHCGAAGGYMLIAAAARGASVAMNTGANDGASNVGPAAGSRAVTLTGGPSSRISSPPAAWSVGTRGT